MTNVLNEKTFRRSNSSMMFWIKETFFIGFFFVLQNSLVFCQVHHDYCIIGAGPAGLQMAYFLHKAQHDYIVYERNSQAGRSSS